MTTIMLEIDPREHMSDRDWYRLKGEALEDLLSTKGWREAGLVGDLIDARAALLARRHGEALCLIERVLEDIRRQ